MIVETLVAYKLGSEVFEKAILRYIIYWLIWLVSVLFAHFISLTACTNTPNSKSHILCVRLSAVF